MDEYPGFAESRTEGHARVKHIVNIVESFWEAVQDRSLKINILAKIMFFAVYCAWSDFNKSLMV